MFKSLVYMARWQSIRDGRSSARRAVDGNDAPAMTHAGAVDMVDAGDRAILDCKGERGLGIEAEGQRQCSADRPPMGNGDNVLPGMRFDQAMDGGGHAADHLDKALPGGGRLVRRRMPKPVEISGSGILQLLIGEALPIAKILFG